MNDKIYHVILRVWIIATVFIVVMAAHAHCSIVQQARPQTNGIHYTPYATNPYMYMFASVSEIQLAKDDKDSLYTFVTFQPAHTYFLFTESILFCGNISGVFKRGALVITYERVAHKRFNGEACHELISVNTVKEETIQ